jgi:hypothetical protein
MAPFANCMAQWHHLPAGFDLYGATYLLMQEALAWEQAQAACTGLGMSLPTFYSADHVSTVNTEVSKIISAATPWWSGLNDRAIEGTWRWADQENGNLAPNGRGPNSWNPWAEGQPDGRFAENCVAVGGGSSSHLISDLQCSNPYPYVCALPGVCGRF